MTLFVVAFFRDPARQIPNEPGAIVAPADGTVTDIEQLDHVNLLDGPAVKIGIFLSLFDVHINRNPEASRVIELCYAPGKFDDTRRISSNRQNEQLLDRAGMRDPTLSSTLGQANCRNTSASNCQRGPPWWNSWRAGRRLA